MRLLIVSDAWHPQVNGVVRTLGRMQSGLQHEGHEVLVLGPNGLMLPCPSYPEISLSLRPSRQVLTAIREFAPSAVHIATEGPLGFAARRFALARGIPFTTSFHTRFPEYLKLRFRIPRRWTYNYLQAFHAAAKRVLVPSPSIARELEARGFQNVSLWSRGVDTEQFQPGRRRELPFEGPILLYVGRIAIEKNLEAFLKAEVKGTKLVVGDGPAAAELKARFPPAVFLGARFGEALAELYASADVFVFPSLTDTFGLVLLEALASGVPCAAFKVPGPLDVLRDGQTGCFAEGDDLAGAIIRAQALSRDACRTYALENSWERSTAQFRRALYEFDSIPLEVRGDSSHQPAADPGPEIQIGLQL